MIHNQTNRLKQASLLTAYRIIAVTSWSWVWISKKNKERKKRYVYSGADPENFSRVGGGSNLIYDSIYNKTSEKVTTRSNQLKEVFQILTWHLSLFRTTFTDFYQILHSCMEVWNAVTVLCGQLDCDDGHL